MTENTTLDGSTYHTPIGINSYNGYTDTTGAGYNEYEVTVDHLPNGGSFATGNEDVVITFTGGDIYALVTPSGRATGLGVKSSPTDHPFLPARTMSMRSITLWRVQTDLVINFAVANFSLF